MLEEMNSFYILFGTSLMITVSISYHVVEKTDFESMYNLRYVNECTKELNLTKYNFTVAYFRSIGIPKTLDEGCLLDCYHFKMGQIEKKKQPDYTEHAFVGQPPKSGFDLTNKSDSDQQKLADAERDCGKFLTTLHPKECHLVFHHRYCVSKVMNGYQLRLKHDKITDEELKFYAH